MKDNTLKQLEATAEVAQWSVAIRGDHLALLLAAAESAATLIAPKDPHQALEILVVSKLYDRVAQATNENYKTFNTVVAATERTVADKKTEILNALRRLHGTDDNT